MSAVGLAERMGWMGEVDRPITRREMAPRRGRGVRGVGQNETTVPPAGPAVDVSVYTLQDALSILGFYSGAKDGNWSPAVGEALSNWATERGVRMSVTPKPDGQTVSFAPEETLTHLLSEARGVAQGGRAGPRPWWFWPLVLTGSAAGIYLVVWLVKGRKSMAQ